MKQLFLNTSAQKYVWQIRKGVVSGEGCDKSIDNTRHGVENIGKRNVCYTFLMGDTKAWNIQMLTHFFDVGKQSYEHYKIARPFLKKLLNFWNKHLSH
jgi:hypothetical protein